MTQFASAEGKTSVTDPSIDLDERDARALTEYLTVLENVGRVRGSANLFLVVSESGREYLVDARRDACECADSEYRNPDGGCKHVRRVAFATGERAIPAAVDRNTLDDQLGEHVSGEPRQAATDGGEEIGDLREMTGEAEPDDGCDCEELPDGWPCADCHISGEKELPSGVGR